MNKVGKVLLLAFRNVLRNKRRSLLAAGVLVIGVVSLVLFGGYIEAVYHFFGNSVIAQQGHFQISLKGYRDGEEESLSHALTLEEQQKIRDFLAKKGGVKVVSPRISLSGILGNVDRSTIFVGFGIDPNKEIDLLHMVGYKGGNLGVLLEADTIIVGKLLAKQMGLKVGDRVTLMSMGEGGSLEAVYAKIGDLLSTGVRAMDSRLVLGDLATMQELLYTTKVHTMVVLLEERFSRRDGDMYVKSLQEEFDREGLNYEVRLWYELDDTYLPTMRMFQTIFTILTVIFLVVIGFTIVNTMYMAVMERVSEVGTIQALGTSPRMIFGMFVGEGTLIGMVATGVGLVVGVLLIVALNKLALPLPPYPGQTESYPLTFIISGKVLVWAALFNIVGALVASMIPAKKALSFTIVEALRHV